MYQVFLDVRNAAARILEHTMLADIVGATGASGSKSGKRQKKKKEEVDVPPMVIHGNMKRENDECGSRIPA